MVLDCLSLCDFSPTGRKNQNSEFDNTSREIVAQVKRGNSDAIRKLIEYHLAHYNGLIKDNFLSKGEFIAVPVPRSSLSKDGSVWPSKVISEVFFDLGLVSEVKELIERVSPIRSSHLCAPDERPLIHEHCETLQFNNMLYTGSNFLLIDDVITRGRTLSACSQVLANSVETHNILGLAVMKSLLTDDPIQKLFVPKLLSVESFNTGKSFVKVIEEY